MKSKKVESGRFDHSGSSFDSFLEEEGTREEVEAVAIKRVLAWQLLQAMREQHKTKQIMAHELGTSRSQLDRLLDPEKVSISLQTLARAAKVLGKSLVIQISDSKTSAKIGRKSAGASRSGTSKVKKPICA
jgi:antitoxin HicB